MRERKRGRRERGCLWHRERDEGESWGWDDKLASGLVGKNCGNGGGVCCRRGRREREELPLSLLLSGPPIYLFIFFDIQISPPPFL